MADKQPFPFPNPYGPPGTPADARKLVHFQTDGVQPPSALYTDVNSSLFIGAWSTDTNPAVTVLWKHLSPRGEVLTNSQTFTITAAPRVKQQFSVPLTEGFLLSAHVLMTQGAGQQAARGQTRVVLQLLSGSFTSGNLIQTLAEGMIDAHNVLLWPGGTYEPTCAGQGYIRSVTGTAPAAGAEVTEVVPVNARWKLRTFRFVFTTSATVATRAVVLVIDDGTNALFAIEAPTSQAASLTNQYNYSQIGGRFGLGVGNNQSISIPDIILAPGWRVRTSTVALQAGDQYTAPQYNVEEFLSQ